MDEGHADRAAHDHADIDRHVRAALLVFGALLLLTGFTVAAWFMHLVSERTLIYWVLGLTAVLFVPLLLLPTFTVLDHIVLR